MGENTFQLLGNEITPFYGNIESLTISDRIGNIPRKIHFPDGSMFETSENDAIDNWLLGTSHSAKRTHTIHLLENRWSWITTALVVTIFVSFSLLRWGLPWASKEIAFSLPQSANTFIASGTLDLLDKILFEPSDLSEKRKQKLQAHFQQYLVPESHKDLTFQLKFRRMPMGGDNESDVANAFALPSGDIVITDRLINIADNQSEIDSILLHEIGHVVNHHSMRQVLQASAITVVAMMVVGDTTVLEGLAVGMPSFLLESHYSRTFEAEADTYAFERMIALNIDPALFGTIMARITGDISSVSEKSSTEKTPHSMTQYLSSHPNTEDRIKQANHYSDIYKTQKKLP